MAAVNPTKILGSDVATFETGDFLPISAGGTGGVTAADARANLDVPISSHGHALTDAAITGILPTSKGGLGFDASALGVSSAEFAALDGVTSPIQAQLNAKISSLALFAGGGNLPYSTRDAALTALASGTTVTTAQLSFLSGASSNLQAQINGKLATPSVSASDVPRWNGGAFAASAITDDTTYLRILGRTVGIGATTFVPGRRLEVRDSTAAQLRLTDTAGTFFADFRANGSGFLDISTSGTSLSIGSGSSVSGAETVVIGRVCTGVGARGVSIGNYCTIPNADAVAIGTLATVTGDAAVSIGRGASAGANAVALGFIASAASNAIALGANASAAAGEFALGTAITKFCLPASPTVPASATAAGRAGQVAWSSGFFYLCVAANTWQRVAIATWA